MTMTKAQARINATEEIRIAFKIETPMKMNYREAYAWQLGWSEGYKAAVEELKDD